jgi:hypothetical protein
LDSWDELSIRLNKRREAEEVGKNEKGVAGEGAKSGKKYRSCMKIDPKTRV